MVGADLNIELVDPQANDGDDHVGAAMARGEPARPSEYHDMVRAFVRGSGLKLHNTFNKWWKTALTDDYSDRDDDGEQANDGSNRFAALRPPPRTRMRIDSAESTRGERRMDNHAPTTRLATTHPRRGNGHYTRQQRRRTPSLRLRHPAQPIATASRGRRPDARRNTPRACMRTSITTAPTNHDNDRSDDRRSAARSWSWTRTTATTTNHDNNAGHLTSATLLAYSQGADLTLRPTTTTNRGRRTKARRSASRSGRWTRTTTTSTTHDNRTGYITPAGQTTPAPTPTTARSAQRNINTDDDNKAGDAPAHATHSEPTRVRHTTISDCIPTPTPHKAHLRTFPPRSHEPHGGKAHSPEESHQLFWGNGQRLPGTLTSGRVANTPHTTTKGKDHSEPTRRRPDDARHETADEHDDTRHGDARRTSTKRGLARSHLRQQGTTSDRLRGQRPAHGEASETWLRLPPHPARNGPAL